LGDFVPIDRKSVGLGGCGGHGAAAYAEARRRRSFRCFMLSMVLPGGRGDGTSLDMGLTDVEMILKGPSGSGLELRMLVDSGAIWSVLPEDVWRALGLEQDGTCEFSLADCSVIQRGISQCIFCYQGVERWSPVVLGERDDLPLLGAVTLETLAL